MGDPKRLHKLCDGQVYFWVEQGSSIHLKAVSGRGDSVEMTFQEAREMARLLGELAEEGERAESPWPPEPVGQTARPTGWAATSPGGRSQYTLEIDVAFWGHDVPRTRRKQMDRDEVLRRAATPPFDLRGADLRGMELRGARLDEADLLGADLRGADLSMAVLMAADLRRADLRGAKLRGANLFGADLRGATLRGADLTDADLDAVKLNGATMPDGTIQE